MIRTDFAIDHERLRDIAPLMDDYGVAEDDGEWPNNVLSRRTVIWESGAFGRHGDEPRLEVDTDELALCRRFAAEVKAVAGDMAVGMGSEASDPFLPFFIAADVRDVVPARIDAALIAARFKGTLFPAFSIAVEPLEETTTWWSEVATDSGAEVDARWRTLLETFRSSPHLADRAFVSIGQASEGVSLDETRWPPGTVMAPSLFPRLPLGLTRNGSLCGLLGWSVMT